MILVKSVKSLGVFAPRGNKTCKAPLIQIKTCTELAKQTRA